MSQAKKQVDLNKPKQREKKKVVNGATNQNPKQNKRKSKKSQSSKPTSSQSSSKNEVINLGMDLTKQEERKAEQVLSLALNPTRAHKIPRPFCVRSTPQYQAGEIIIDSISEYLQFIMTPDPWRFITLKQLAPPSTITFSETDYVENLINVPGANTQLVAGSLQSFLLNATLVRVDGNLNEPTYTTGDGTGNTVNQQGNFEFAGPFPCFPGLSITGSITYQVVNRSLGSLLTQPAAFVIDAVSGNVIQSSTGSSVTLAAQANNTMTFSPSLTIGAGQALMFAVFVTANTANTQWRDLSIGLVAGSISSANEPVVKTYTVGEAVFGSAASPQSQLLMDMFTNAQLWAPNSCSATLNVNQQMNVAGGSFQTAFLPSHIEKQINSDIASSWTQIAGFGKSYPVAESKFVQGCHVSWVGGRVADYEFREPFTLQSNLDAEYSALPKAYFTSRKVDTTVIDKYFFNFAVCFEVQSINPLLTMTMSPFSNDLLPILSQIWSNNQNLVGENPNHLARVKKLVKQAIDDPRVRKAFKQLLSAGATGLLAMI